MTKPYKCRVEYLESTGTQYINTEYQPVPATTRFEILFTPTTSTANFIFGARPDTSVGASSCTTYKPDIRIRKDWAGSSDFFTLRVNTTDKFLYTAHDNTISLNDEVYTGTITKSTTRLSYDFALFTVNTAGTFDSRMFAGKIYYAKLWDDDVLARDLIPVIDNSNRPAMYDQVSGQLFYNQGEGEFNVGPYKLESSNKKLLRKKLALMLSEQEQKKKRPYYCEVEYLESTGTQYINTGMVSTENSKVDCIFGFSSMESGAVNNVGVFGGRGGTTSNTFTLFKIASANPQYFRFDYNGQPQVATANQMAWNTTSKYRFEYMGVQIITTNLTTGESVTTTRAPGSTFTRYPICLFAVNTSGTMGQYLSGRIYRYWYTDGTNTIDLIPVLDWDMRPAMYDKVSGELYYNQGTGEFLYGREIHQVKYLESTGTQYIDTGITQNSNIKAELNIYPTVINKFIFGSRISAGSDGFGIFMHSNNGGSWYPFFNAATTMIPGFVVNEKYDIAFSKDGLFVNNQLLEGPYTSVFTGTLNIYLFAMNSNGTVDTRLFIGKIYSTKLYDNGVIVRDYIPAIDENGVGFMFDRVSHTIYDNAGTDAFVYPPVELEYLESGGGPYIDTGIKPTDEYGYHVRNTYRYNGGEQCAIGSMDAGNRFVGVYTGGTQISGGWGSFVGYLKASYKFEDDTIFDVYCNYKNDRQIIVNDEPLKDLTDVHINGTIANTIYLFARHYGNNITKMYGRIYSTEITKGSDVVAHFVPCIKDGQLGMWDKVNEVFYPNIGTGDFIGGKIIERG